MDLVEITLPNGVSSLTQAELDSLKQKIVLLLGDVQLRVRELKTDHRTEAAILIFYVEKLVSFKVYFQDHYNKFLPTVR